MMESSIGCRAWEKKKKGGCDGPGLREIGNSKSRKKPWNVGRCSTQKEKKESNESRSLKPEYRQMINSKVCCIIIGPWTPRCI